MRFLVGILICFSFVVAAVSPSLSAAKKSDNSYSVGGVTYFRPATLKTTDLKRFDQLSESRRKLITHALDTASKNKWMKYLPPRVVAIGVKKVMDMASTISDYPV